MTSLVLIDADVLGRQRTGDETYVANLLRELPAVAGDFRFVAVTRHPELIPPGVEPLELPARSQELRMAWTLPRLMRRVRPDLGHFQHALPLRCPAPAVVTIHDLSFERDPKLLGRKDRLVFRTVVPRAVRKAVRVIAVSERTKADLVELYGVSPERITVTHHGIDPVFTPGGHPDSYALFVGTIQARKDPLAAADAAAAAGLRLVVVGPTRDRELARELERRGAELRGYLERPALADLYRGAACLVLPSRYEGFGCPCSRRWRAERRWWRRRSRRCARSRRRGAVRRARGAAGRPPAGGARARPARRRRPGAGEAVQLAGDRAANARGVRKRPPCSLGSSGPLSALA